MQQSQEIINDELDWQSKFIHCDYSSKLFNKILFLNNTAKKKLDLDLIKKSIYYARKYHDGQMRQSGEPYISHPIEVAYMLCDYLWDTNAIAAAVLHDVIEDTCLTYEMIKILFNDIIAGYVLDLTRVILPNGKKVSCEEMIEEWVKAGKKNVMLIKLFDRFHNLQTISVKNPEKIKKIADETLVCFVSLAMYLDINQVADKLTAICYESLMIKKRPALLLGQEFFGVQENLHYLALAFQSDANQK